MAALVEKSVPLSKLFLASEAPEGFDLEVRKADSNGIDELAATIRRVGLLHRPVTLTHKGKLYVISGNLRLMALRSIHGSDDPEIGINDADGFKGDPRQLALAANEQKEMHPADRYEAIARLLKDGMTSGDVIGLLALSDRQYRQAMALGQMSPKVRDAWRAGEIDAETAKAFTLSDDPKEQDKAFEGAKKSSYGNKIRQHDIAHRLGSKQDAGKFVLFVGLENVRKAGLLKQEDLFGHDHTVTSVPALKKLADAKMTDICKRLTDGGWKWAQSYDSVEHYGSYYGRTDGKTGKPTPEEKAELDAMPNDVGEWDGDLTEAEEAMQDRCFQIQAAIAERGYSPEQKAKSGVIIRLLQSGQLQYDYGRTKPAEKKAAEAAERGKAASDKSKKKKTKAAKEGGAVITNALAERLSGQLEIAGAEILKIDHALAVSALIAGFASEGHIIDVHVGAYGSSGSKKKPDFMSVFEGAYKSSPQQREAMLAQIAAQAIAIETGNADKMPLTDKDIIGLFKAMRPEAVSKAIATAWDAKDYFNSVSREAIFQAVLESMGDEHATKVAKMDKGSAAKFATGNVPTTGWLPLPLRTAHYAFKAKGSPTKTKAAPKAEIIGTGKRRIAKKAAKAKAKK